MINYNEIDPGVRRLVRWLNDRGYRTTDSGDGVTKVGTMDCALRVANVAILATCFDLVQEARSLLEDFAKIGVIVENIEGATIQATYSPIDNVAVILLLGVSDEHLPPDVSGLIDHDASAHVQCKRCHASREGGMCLCGGTGDELAWLPGDRGYPSPATQPGTIDKPQPEYGPEDWRWTRT